MDKLGRRFKLVPVHAPGTRNGKTGQPWRDMLPPPGKHWQYAPSKLDEFDRQGDIHWSRNGTQGASSIGHQIRKQHLQITGTNTATRTIRVSRSPFIRPKKISRCLR